jgi:tRNA-2-methylthio-N6-dimethylallyladenosine synthase
MVEGWSRKDPTELMARTECNRVVNFQGGPQSERLIGQMLDIHITQAFSHTLRGDVVLKEIV